MNKRKTLIGLLVIGLGLFGTVSALGAKLPHTNAPAGKAKYRPHAVEIPRAEPAGPGMPCREARRWPKVTTYTGCDTPANRAAGPSTNAKTFLKAHAQALELRQDLADLKVAKVKEGLSRTVTRLQQTFGNLPVLNAFVTVQQRPSERVTNVNTSYISDPLIAGAATPAIAREAAEAIALAGIRQRSGVLSPTLRAKTRAELSWFPVDGRSVKLVWAMKTRTRKPIGNFYTLVDANTGGLLLQENRIVFVDGTGMAHVPNPIQTSGILDLVDTNGETSPFLEQQRISVILSGLAGNTTLLKGDFVDVTTSDPLSCYLPELCPNADNVSRDYVYTRDQPEFEQVVIYHAIDSVQRYLIDLGFQDTQENATIRNYPTLAIAHSSADDRSYYEPDVYEDPNTFELRGALNFGDGGVDDAEDADIIVHEFGHAIQNDQNAVCFPGDVYTPQVNEARAMGEGFSDYLAASFYANQGDPAYQSTNAACVGEWDSTSYPTPRSCLRRVDGNKHYPDKLIGEEHADGEIWSAALWDIHAEPAKGGLGGPRTDQLVLEHHLNLDCSSGVVTMPQAALAMIDTTTDANEKDILRAKFCKRGILVDSACAESPIEKRIVVGVQKDSTLAKDAPNRNEGASSELRLRSVSEKGNKVMRIVLAFDLSKIKPAAVDTARLVMTVQHNPGGWGRKGRNVAVLPLKAASFPEGNATLIKAGSGKGITWNCNSDNNISNAVKDCNKAWKGGDANRWTAAPFVHTNGLKTGDVVTWDVSDDIKDGATAWLVKKRNQNSERDGAGEIIYFAKEGNTAMAPRIEITLK